MPGLSDILSLAPALHAVPSRHPFTWPWAAMGFARAQPAPASPWPLRPPRPALPWPLWGKLFQIVLGLMCPGGLCRGGESQNGAKSRRFGMDMPSRAFYEGVNPKTILNNCKGWSFIVGPRQTRGLGEWKRVSLWWWRDCGHVEARAFAQECRLCVSGGR